MCQQRLGLVSKSVPLVVLSLFLSVSVVHADTAVIVGAPQIGAWTVSGYIANPTSSPIDLSEGPCPPPLACPALVVQTLPALSSVALNSFLPPTGFGSVYISGVDESTLVRARLTNSLDFGGTFSYNRSVDIPVVFVSQIVSANLSTLNFGGVTNVVTGLLCVIDAPCFSVGYSNLVLANVLRTDDKPGEDLPVTLELFDSNGNAVGSSSLTIPYGQTIITGVGAPFSAAGLLRVTRTSGGALMWGILYTQDVGGNVSASAGVNLSP